MNSVRRSTSTLATLLGLFVLCLLIAAPAALASGFQPHVDYVTGIDPASVASGDFNGDGKLDLVTGDYDEEYRIVRPDGSVRWIRDRAFPVQDNTGSVSG